MAPVDGRYNILLLGADAGDGRDGLRPDSISVVSIDAKTGQSTIIGLPRELTGMPFPEDSPMHELHPTGFGNDWGCYIGRCYMNGLYTEISIFDPDRYAGVAKAGEEPGILALVDAASGATGLDVQFYVLIDMDGFSDLIDALGGVDINVQQRLPIGGDAHGNGIEGWIEAGQQHMNGFNAQWYARSRYTTDDYDRMRRQRELQEAILAQMNPVNVLKQFKDIVETGSSIVWTNMPESMLGPFLDLATRAKDHTPVTVELTPPEVQPEAPDYDYIHELVADAVRQASPAEEEE
ncbi:MAG: LCP family protein [Microbacteriaceae bacterium]